MGVRTRASELLCQDMDVVLLLQILQPQCLDLMLQPLYLRVKLHGDLIWACIIRHISDMRAQPVAVCIKSIYML